MCISLDVQSNIYITKMYGIMSIKIIDMISWISSSFYELRLLR
jgi:hypothetical protein